MKSFRAGIVGTFVLLSVSLYAQPEKSAAPAKAKPPTPEELAKLPATDRAMQEYISRRSERLKERETTLVQAKAAKTEDERKAIMAKLEADEHAFRVKNADLARQAHPRLPSGNVAPPPVAPATSVAPAVLPSSTK